MGSGKTNLIISNEEMNDIIKIVQALEDSNILLKGVTKGIVRAGSGNKKGKGIVRVGSRNRKGKWVARAGTGKP